jgi:Cu/Ag efflux pump CusA
VLSRIVQFSLRFPGVVVALACVVLAYGVFVALHARLDVFPEFAPPMVVIQTEAPGLSPEQVEVLVTRPVENAINGAPRLVSIRSQSIQGHSAVTATFADDANVYQARQVIAERLAEVAEQLPQGVRAPRLGPLTSSTSLTLVLGLTSSNRTAMELRTFAEWTLRPRLLGVPGVAKVDVFGGDVRQIQIQVRPDRLVAFNLSLNDVLTAARHVTALHGAGFVENANQRIIVRATGQPVTPAEVGEVVVRHQAGQSVRLRDVAHVVNGAEPKFGDALLQGRPGVALLAFAQYGANTMDVTEALERALDEMQAALTAEGIELERDIFRPATFIEQSLANINKSLLLGGLLVGGVLFLFLLDARTAFISFLSIPLSLLAAVIVLDRFGVSLNTLTLGGFAIAIGVVVDDAIIDVENILRRLRELRMKAGGEAPLTPGPSSAAGEGAREAGQDQGEDEGSVGKPARFDVVLDRRATADVILNASLEVRSAVVYATFIVALVFLPVLTMSGVQGRLFAPLATAFILATLASLVVALTVTPALCLLMLSRVGPHAEPRYVQWLKGRHRRWLEALRRRPRTVIGLALALCLGAGATTRHLGGEFLPEFREGHFVIHMVLTPGTSLQESLRIGGEATRALLQHPQVRSVAVMAGRAENGEDVWDTHMSEIHVDLKPMAGAEAERAQREIRELLVQFPGVVFAVHPFLAERMEETISGTTAEVVVNLFGNDLDALDETARDVQRVMSGVRGAVDVRTETQPGTPEVVFKLRPERFTQFGFRPDEVLEAVQTAFQGTTVAEIYEGNRVFDVVVALDPAQRKDPESIGALLLQDVQGSRLPLRELADIYPSSGRHMIVHDGARRRQQVVCNVEGRDVASFLAELKERVADEVRFPAGVYPAYGGSAELQARARRELLVHSVLAGAGIVLLLALVFRAGRNLLLLLTNLPFALVGGVLAVVATGGVLSIGTLVGFVTLFGITMRNSIMMVSHFEHLVRAEGMTWGPETALRGASERLLPILMTALVTALGLLPLALGSGEPGREIEGPMAIVILGGLVTSTLLNLLVLPTLALRYGRFSRGP